MTFTVMSKTYACNKSLKESVIEVNAGKLHEMLVVRVQDFTSFVLDPCLTLMLGRFADPSK